MKKYIILSLFGVLVILNNGKEIFIEKGVRINLIDSCTFALCEEYLVVDYQWKNIARFPKPNVTAIILSDKKEAKETE